MKPFHLLLYSITLSLLPFILQLRLLHQSQISSFQNELDFLSKATTFRLNLRHVNPCCAFAHALNQRKKPIHLKFNFLL